jgi:hypothetical protein
VRGAVASLRRTVRRSGDVVGPREQRDALLFVGHLDAVQGHVEIAATEEVEQHVPLALHRRARTPSSAASAARGRPRSRSDDSDPSDPEDVRRAALRVGTPAELAAERMRARRRRSAPRATPALTTRTAARKTTREPCRIGPPNGTPRHPRFTGAL